MLFCSVGDCYPCHFVSKCLTVPGWATRILTAYSGCGRVRSAVLLAARGEHGRGLSDRSDFLRVGLRPPRNMRVQADTDRDLLSVPVNKRVQTNTPVNRRGRPLARMRAPDRGLGEPGRTSRTSRTMRGLIPAHTLIAIRKLAMVLVTRPGSPNCPNRPIRPAFACVFVGGPHGRPCHAVALAKAETHFIFPLSSFIIPKNSFSRVF